MKSCALVVSAVLACVCLSAEALPVRVYHVGGQRSLRRPAGMPSDTYAFLAERMRIRRTAMGAWEPLEAAEASAGAASGAPPTDGPAPGETAKSLTFASGTQVTVYAPRELDRSRLKLVADRVTEVAGNTTSSCFCRLQGQSGEDETTPFANVDCLCMAKDSGLPVNNARPSAVPLDMYGERLAKGEDVMERLRYPLPADVQLTTDGLLMSLDAGDRKSWDGSGKWRDVSGTELAATMEGHAVFDETEGSGSIRFGQEGDGDRAVVTGLDISPRTHKSLTIEAWVKLHSLPNPRGYLVTHDNGQGNLDRTLMMHDSRFAEPGATEGATALGAGKEYTSSLGKPSLERWMQVVAVWTQDGPSAVYRDTVRGEGPMAFNLDGAANLCIGSHQFLPDHHVDAHVAVVRVYDRALSEGEVKANFDFMAPRFGV
mmetsp:Transcript_22825/g.73455  ORF Transcript_22825/g.73455 Transcript_22825/m.73455 type:complete len:429 (+) Transcript_22825:1-1287(+)